MKYILISAVFVMIILAGCSNNSAPTSTNSITSTSYPTVPANATTSFERTEVLCPTNNEQAKQFYNTGIELQEQGKLDNAKLLFQKAIELDPEFCDAMDNLGQLLRSQGNIDDAIYWYKKSINILPNNPVAHQNLALAYSFQGNFDNAIAEYKLLLTIDPNNPEGYYGLGVTYLQLDQPQNAINQLERANELYEKLSSPYALDAKFSLGVAHIMLDEYESAKAYFEKIYPYMESDEGVNYYLGLCYLSPELKNLELAKRYLRKAQELGVDLPEDVLKEIE